MIRRTRTIIFLAIILGSTVLLGVSSFYQIDTYRAFSFTVEITEMRLFKNETSSEYRRIEVDIQMYNPSLTVILEFRWAETQLFLNNENLRYGWGTKGNHVLIPPGEGHEFRWHYSVTDEDFPILQVAESSGTWNWFLYLEPFVNAGSLGQNEVTRFLLFQGVNLVFV